VCEIEFRDGFAEGAGLGLDGGFFDVGAMREDGGRGTEGEGLGTRGIWGEFDETDVLGCAVDWDVENLRGLEHFIRRSIKLVQEDRVIVEDGKGLSRMGKKSVG
jgi:hypothetical protein